MVCTSDLHNSRRILCRWWGGDDKMFKDLQLLYHNTVKTLGLSSLNRQLGWGDIIKVYEILKVSG